MQFFEAITSERRNCIMPLYMDLEMAFDQMLRRTIDWALSLIKSVHRYNTRVLIAELKEEVTDNFV